MFGVKELIDAAEEGNVEALNAVLDSGMVDINAKEESNGFGALHWGGYRGHSKILELLLARGANVNALTNNGSSALYWTARSGHAKCVAILLGAGGDVHQCDKFGAFPLHDAAENGHMECVKLLVEAKAYVDARDRSGYSPLFGAISNGQRETAELLIEVGAPIPHTLSRIPKWVTAIVEKRANCKRAAFTIYGVARKRLGHLCFNYPFPRDIARILLSWVWETRSNPAWLQASTKRIKACNHKCKDKTSCAHKCCF